LPACAVNLNEARPARVLRGGEMEVSNINAVVVPFRVINDVIPPARNAIKALRSDEEPTEEERAAREQEALEAAAAIAIQGPGYGNHLAFGMGLGYRYDLSARMGNGIYGLSLRRGFDLGNWDASVGTRALYSAGTWIPYLDTVSDVVKVTDMTRFDGQLFAQLGREWGEWGRLWFGAKGIYAHYDVELDTSRLQLEEAMLERLEFGGHMFYAGGFVGLALGFRYVFFVMELTGLYTVADVTIFDETRNMSGPVLVPSWGFRGNF
jgi:hypothetical protein